MRPGDTPHASNESADDLFGGSECPPASLLRRIGDDEIAPELYFKLESHVEGCTDCQAILQDWADSDRMSAISIDPQSASGDLIDTDEFEAVPAIPGFRLIRELGRGGEAVVHLAEEIETQRLVALKFLPGGWMSHPAGRSRWLRQVRATALIQHANVVRLYRIEETSRWYVMVLEYIRGGTLRDRVKEPLAPEVAATLVQRLATAVEVIHRAGVWHLDLKPSNVLLDGPESTPPEKCVPKISDFGIAMRNELASTEPSHGGGTPAFMAPEQASKDTRQLGQATDVYGLGAILFFLLTARPPFVASSTRRLISRVRSEPLRFPPSAIDRIDPRLIAICRKAMAKSPADRQPNPGTLAKELGQWLDANHPRKSRSGDSVPADVSVSWRKMKATAKVCVATFAVFVFTGTLWFLLGDRQARDATIPLKKNEWIQELRQVEPRVFFGSRLQSLITTSRLRTEEILGGSPADPVEMARTGMLLQAMGARFCASLHKDLFESADDLFECSLRLLERSHELDPENQATIRELALAEFAFGNVKGKDLESQEDMICAKLQEDVRHFERAAIWIDLLKDRRSRVHIASQVLDRTRDQANIAKLKGLSKAAQIWDTFHRKCESRWSDLAESEEIRLRLALYDRREFEHANTSETRPDATALDEKSRLLLEHELVMYRLEPLVFRAEGDTSDPDESEIKSVLDDAEHLLRRLRRKPDSILTIAFEELIRPVATVSTWFRAQGEWTSAHTLSRRYRKIGHVLESRYPERFETYLILSEASLQDWKNALKAEDPASAEAALKVSLKMALRAIELAPGNLTARSMFEDRESRLARFQADR